ncbi:hypothetical protein [Halopiger djelfimassiliensis]|uniref:hypothetical protein n=1 Tax=Halopiger djelfimassiliensis TaxID=1293047 RepID=UPI000677623C|nr:hypothetical protein [Halopiger djelfimassiliensis]
MWAIAQRAVEPSITSRDASVCSAIATVPRRVTPTVRHWRSERPVYYLGEPEKDVYLGPSNRFLERTELASEDGVL